MGAVKALLAQTLSQPLDEELEAAIAANAQQRATDDFKEGVQLSCIAGAPIGPASK